MKTAFLGLGTMGYHMAGHLANAGFDIQVYNRTLSIAQRWQQEFGGNIAITPTAATKNADVVCMCLGNDEDVRSVAYSELGAIAGMKSGSVLIDHTTTSSELACELAASCEKVGVEFLDAPVSGGEVGAQKGSLTIMVGGDNEVLDKVSTVLSSYSQKCDLMGNHGAGQLTKMVNQICIAGLLQGLSEGLNFAMLNNLDCEKLLSLISKGAAQSWQMDNRGRTMVAGDFDFGFSVKWMVKDLQICFHQAQQSDAVIPITEQVLQRYQQLQKQGDEKLDTSSLIRLLKE